MKTPLFLLLFLALFSGFGCTSQVREEADSQMAQASALEVISSFVESLANGDSTQFYSQIDRDSIFVYLKAMGGYKESFAPDRVHAPYFFNYGILIPSPFVEKVDPNPITTFRANNTLLTDSILEYEVQWAFRPGGSKEEGPLESQKFRVRRDRDSGRWKITLAEFKWNPNWIGTQKKKHE